MVQHNHSTWQGKRVDKKSWGYYMNIALRSAHGDYVVMVSDDCLLVKDSVMNAYNLFERETSLGNKIGAIAFYWRNLPYEKMYYVRQTLGHKLSVNHGMFLKKALEQAGYCEEDSLAFYYGDGDLSLKIWNNGYVIVDCKGSFVEHFHFANMRNRRLNSQNKEKYKKVYMDKWRGIYYDESIDNQSGKIFLKFGDKGKVENLLRFSLLYYVGVAQSKLGSIYGYEHKSSDRLPSIEMLSNLANIDHLLNSFKLKSEQLCVFAVIKNKDKILLGLREYVKDRPVWTFPGGRGQAGETLTQSLKREIREEIGVEDVNFIKVIGKKEGVKKGDRVYFIETEIFEEPKLMEPDLFKEWRWCSIHDLPKNMIDANDIEIIKRIF